MAVSILVEISPGELIDKLTILEIKREQVGEPAKLANVEFEYAALRAVFDRQIVPTDDIEALYDTLREVNRRLWSIEDAIRDCERGKDFGTAFVALARSVYQTNDRRAEIKRAINTRLNSSLIEEKAYAAY